MKLILLFIWLFITTSVSSEEINFEVYELTNDGKKLLHKENLVYNYSDITISQKHGDGKTCSDKRLALWEKFGLSSCVYRKVDTSGFGLSIDKNYGGFSWEWFSQSGNCDCDKTKCKDEARYKDSRILEIVDN